MVGDEGDEGVEREGRRRDATKKRTNQKVLGKCPQEVLEKRLLTHTVRNIYPRDRWS